MSHTYYSLRTGKNDNLNGFSLQDFIGLFLRVYNELRSDGYFDESFGFYCVDEGDVCGKVADIELEILLKVRKKNLWPIENYCQSYTEDDLFDIIEFLYQYVSKPIDGTYHEYSQCGMHWETFNAKAGKEHFVLKMNELLPLYREKFELSSNGEVLHKSENGFEKIFEADVPSNDDNITTRVNSAILGYRRHGSSLDDRRQSVRDLSDVLEYLRPKVKNLLSKKDEKDLFDIANNFGIRHHNDKQKTSYDTGIWLSWMFYFYLSTIHVVLRKIENENLTKQSR